MDRQAAAFARAKASKRLRGWRGLLSLLKAEDDA
jgi:hypothetical protein